ncbi:MAG: hypothetical protein JXR97_00865 [Planctomycetes bacterium]|nr:hypothetical protein [Planctomycetota bacterium]
MKPVAALIALMIIFVSGCKTEKPEHTRLSISKDIWKYIIDHSFIPENGNTYKELAEGSKILRYTSAKGGEFIIIEPVYVKDKRNAFLDVNGNRGYYVFRKDGEGYRSAGFFEGTSYRLINTGKGWLLKTTCNESVDKQPSYTYEWNGKDFQKIIKPIISDKELEDILAKGKNGVHTFKFGNYSPEGTDPHQLAYIINGHEIGKGDNGWDTLQYIISKMKKGDMLRLEYDLSGGGRFPFSLEELIHYADGYGVEILTPTW